jgi:hypothetical protein
MKYLYLVDYTKKNHESKRKERKDLHPEMNGGLMGKTIEIKSD